MFFKSKNINEQKLFFLNKKETIKAANYGLHFLVQHSHEQSRTSKDGDDKCLVRYI